MSVPAQNAIPAHPGVAAQAAAAGPAVRTNEQNPIIPLHPAIAAQMAQSRGQPAPQPVSQGLGEDFESDGGEANPQADWFSAAGTGQPTPERFREAPPQAPPTAPVVQGQPQQQPSYSDIDSLLEGIPVPGEVQAQPVQQQVQPTQGQAQQQVAQPQAPQQVPGVQQPPAVPAAPPAFDAEAAQRAAIDQLMGRDYALSEADQRRLIAEPETVIPRLAAQVHVNVVRDIGSRIGPIVQALVAQGVEQRLEGVKREAEFYGRYPKLARAEFRPIVESSLAMVKAANPNITLDQLFQEGASYAAFRIRQHFRQGVPQQQQSFQAPQAPMVRQQPFVPMSPGAPSVPQAPGQSNPFADLANTDLFDW